VASYRLTLCWLVVTLASVLFNFCADAHEPSKSYLNLTVDSVGHFIGQWDIPLRDLETVVPLERDRDGFIEQEQINVHYREITDYAFSHLQITFDGQLVEPQLTNNQPNVENLADGTHLQLHFTLPSTSQPQMVGLNYQLFFQTNSLHRGLMRLEAGGKTQLASFSPEHSSQQFQLTSPVSPGQQFLVFLHEGVWHIWTGFDHILFLLALLLPSVLQRGSDGWREVNALRPAFFNVLKIVTAFTVAHSLTLSLATLGILKLPSRLTESAIAVSVALAAANNLWPLIRERGWMVAFGFGLVHGFGFATALSDLGLTHGSLALALVGFNLGVEVGQLAIVATFVPIAFALRRSWFYQSTLLRFTSASIILVAGAWCAERVLDVKFMPF